jgi:hypoxanthine phosphoribosyltransferase
MEEKLGLSFIEISNAIKKYPFPKVELVVGIGRGGIVPAALVAYQLSVDIVIAEINYRDDNHQPRYAAPKFLSDLDLEKVSGKILIVDDVSVSGKTIAQLKDKLKGMDSETFVLKGNADHVLFPDIKNCVNWPWKTSPYKTT